MKKLLGLLLSGILLVSCLIGCTNKEDVKVAVNKEIDNYYNEVITNLNDDGSDVFASIIFKIYQNTEVTYKDIVVDDNKATVTLIIENKNVDNINKRATDLAKSRIDLLTPVETLYNNALWEVYELEEPEEREITIHLYQYNSSEEWFLDPQDNNTFLYGVSGIRK